MREGKWPLRDRAFFITAMPLSMWSGAIGTAQSLMGVDPKAAFAMAAATAFASVGVALTAQATQAARQEFAQSLSL